MSQTFSEWLSGVEKERVAFDLEKARVFPSLEKAEETARDVQQATIEFSDRALRRGAMLEAGIWVVSDFEGVVPELKAWIVEGARMTFTKLRVPPL
jgi:hypothetical protein